MKKRQSVFFVALYLLTVFFAPAAEATQPESIAPFIRVGLWKNQRNISVVSDRAYVLLDEKRKMLARYLPGEKIFLTLENGKLLSNKKEIGTESFEIAPLAAGGAISINNKAYRGRVFVNWNAKTGIRVVNTLDLETYLYSIVPSEMPSTWHFEALKAQAVAARSFALASLHGHDTDGYDVCATTHCQVYNGKSAETERARMAVDATAGVALYFENQPITAVFHSSSGGRTENAADVWGRDVPYLQSVKDFDEGTPNYEWEKRLSPETVSQRLASSGYPIGKMQAIQVSKLHFGGVNGGDRTKVGHIKSMRFIGDKGNITIGGDKVRSIFGLKSTLFDIELEIPNVSGIDVEVGSLYKKKIDVKLPAYKETKGWFTDKESIRRLTGRDGETVVLHGYGFGHGLGLSQWGAKQMAEKVPETNTTYFGRILHHYYTGVLLKKIY